jgi:aspartate kinase
MHNRSIEFAKKFSVPIHVRSSFSDRRGTMIVAEPESPDQPVSGAALEKNEARVTIEGVPDRPGVSLAIFSKIAGKAITVDMIVQNVGAGGKADISFTVPKDELKSTLEAAEAAANELGATGVSHDDQVAKVSVVGLGMARQTGVAQRMFRALADAGVNILMITTSEIKISVLVARDQAQTALRTVHQEFALSKEPQDKPADAAKSGGATVGNKTANGSHAIDVITRLQHMEGLTIEAIELDESQARLTMAGVPDRPGIAAQFFEEIAAGGVFVDMIVQSFGHNGQANLTCTIPQESLAKALEIAKPLAARFGCGPVSSCPMVAKLSVSGIGMRSHTGVAIRMFQSLAAAGINVDMINTSEVRVNVVVDGNQGKAAMACLEKAFADATA